MTDHERKTEAGCLAGHERDSGSGRGPRSMVEGGDTRDGAARDDGRRMQEYHRVATARHREDHAPAGERRPDRPVHLTDDGRGSHPARHHWLKVAPFGPGCLFFAENPRASEHSCKAKVR